MILWKGVSRAVMEGAGLVLRAFIEGAVILFMLLGALWAWETNLKIDALQAAIEELKSKQRPLVSIDGGKYLTVFTQEKEVLIQTRGSSN